MKITGFCSRIVAVRNYFMLNKFKRNVIAVVFAIVVVDVFFNSQSKWVCARDYALFKLYVCILLSTWKINVLFESFFIMNAFIKCVTV